MAQINKPNTHFNTVTYTGTSTVQSITGINFKPDLVWIKNRSRPTNLDHNLTDIVRGVTKHLASNTTSAETTATSRVKTFDSDGFTLDTGDMVNDDTYPYVAWNWLAGGTASSNTDGDITSSVSANTTSGFSIVSWTGSGASNTVGHGLNSPVELIIVKNRTDSATDWRIGNSFLSGQTMADGNGYYLEFDTGAIANPGGQTTWGSPPANPTSTVFKVGSNNSQNGSGDAMIAYCFHSVKAFSKFGSYTGNGSADGTFVYTGFKPAFVITKRTDSAENWDMLDNKRNTYNVSDKLLKPNLSNAEATFSTFDMLSNGFKIRNSDTEFNASGGTYIYMAFAENPLVGTNNIPATAR